MLFKGQGPVMKAIALKQTLAINTMTPVNCWFLSLSIFLSLSLYLSPSRSLSLPFSNYDALNAAFLLVLREQ